MAMPSDAELELVVVLVKPYPFKAEGRLENELLLVVEVFSISEDDMLVKDVALEDLDTSMVLGKISDLELVEEVTTLKPLAVVFVVVSPRAMNLENSTFDIVFDTVLVKVSVLSIGYE